MSFETPITVAGGKRLCENLPPFVVNHDARYQPRTVQSNAWDKPVIHLYGAEGLDVTVTVDTAEGRPTWYWPPPKLKEKVHPTRGATAFIDARRMTWSGRLHKDAPAGLRPVAEDHWWSMARGIPSMYLNTKDGAERFIFYEATGSQAPAVSGKVTADELVLENSDAQESGPVLVIVNDGRQLFWTSLAKLPANGRQILKRTEFLKTAGDQEKLLEAARAQWTSFGLSPTEARAVVEIWKPELLKQEGFLVISRMPADRYEKMFPLQVTPKPKEVVRAGVVFDALSGEFARLQWIPEVKARFIEVAKGLAAEEFEARKAAKARLASYGDLALPVLNDLAKSEDTEVRTLATQLIKELQEEVSVKVRPAHSTVVDYKEFIDKYHGGKDGKLMDDGKDKEVWLDPVP